MLLGYYGNTLSYKSLTKERKVVHSMGKIGNLLVAIYLSLFLQHNNLEYIYTYKLTKMHLHTYVEHNRAFGK